MTSWFVVPTPLTGFNTYRWEDVLPLLARKAGVPVNTTPTPNKIPLG